MCTKTGWFSGSMLKLLESNYGLRINAPTFEQFTSLLCTWLYWNDQNLQPFLEGNMMKRQDGNQVGCTSCTRTYYRESHVLYCFLGIYPYFGIAMENGSFQTDFENHWISWSRISFISLYKFSTMQNHWKSSSLMGKLTTFYGHVQ